MKIFWHRIESWFCQILRSRTKTIYLNSERSVQFLKRNTLFLRSNTLGELEFKSEKIFLFRNLQEKSRTVYIARILDHEKCGDYNLLDSVASPKAGPACFSPKAILRQNNGSTRFFLVTLTYADKKSRHTILRRRKIQTHLFIKS